VKAVSAIVFAAGMAVVANPAFAERPGDCGYYRNSYGHEVPRPCGNWHREAPPRGATALCRDGTFSYSEHPHSGGTCSHHGGVAKYL